jgi:CheY-like chemotaxis protein
MADPECNGSQRKRLLLVADNSNFRRTLERILSRCGYCVDGVECGEAALERLAAGPYDAVISEVFLPGDMCGLTVMDRVRRAYPALPVIFLAEQETARLRSVLDSCERVTCLCLPVDVDLLKQVVAQTTRCSLTSP